MAYRTQKFLLISLIFISLFGFTYSLKAQCDPSGNYCLLAPLPFNGPGNNTNSLSYQNLAVYVDGVVRLAVGIAGVLAVIMIMIGGFQYVTAATINGKNSGRETITNALLGLGLAIAAFLILYSLNPNLVEFKISLDSIGTTSSQTGQDGTGVTDPGAGQKNPGTTTQIPNTTGISPAQGLTDTIWADDSIDRGKFDPNTFFNAANCDFVGRTSCTSLAGISDTVVNDINALEAACNCSVTITGGTEYWNHDGHWNDMSVNTSPHKPGGTVLDLRIDNSSTGMSAFIRAKGTPTTQSGCTQGTERYLYNGSLYVNEVGLPQETGSHWHVCFQ